MQPPPLVSMRSRSIESGHEYPLTARDASHLCVVEFMTCRASVPSVVVLFFELNLCAIPPSLSWLGWGWNTDRLLMRGGEPYPAARADVRDAFLRLLLQQPLWLREDRQNTFLVGR